MMAFLSVRHHVSTPKQTATAKPFAKPSNTASFSGTALPSATTPVNILQRNRASPETHPISSQSCSSTANGRSTAYLASKSQPASSSRSSTSWHTNGECLG